MATKTKTRFTDSGPRFDPIPWRAPSSVPAELAKDIPGLVEAYREGLKPGRKDYLTGRVTVMLGQYFVPDMPFELQALLLADWVDSLNEFPSWAVKAACDRWRDTERRKPTPADIRAICVDLVKPHRNTLERLGALQGVIDRSRALALTHTREHDTGASQDFRLNGLLSGALKRMPGTGDG